MLQSGCIGPEPSELVLRLDLAEELDQVGRAVGFDDDAALHIRLHQVEVRVRFDDLAQLHVLVGHTAELVDFLVMVHVEGQVAAHALEAALVELLLGDAPQVERNQEHEDGHGHNGAYTGRHEPFIVQERDDDEGEYRRQDIFNFAHFRVLFLQDHVHPSELLGAVIRMGLINDSHAILPFLSPARAAAAGTPELRVFSDIRILLY